jgi:hypothetical protein
MIYNNKIDLHTWLHITRLVLNGSLLCCFAWKLGIWHDSGLLTGPCLIDEIRQGWIMVYKSLSLRLKS